LGVEPICDVLQVAPSTYYAVLSRPLETWSMPTAAVSTHRFRACWGFSARRFWSGSRNASYGGRRAARRILSVPGVGSRRHQITAADSTKPGAIHR